MISKGGPKEMGPSSEGTSRYQMYYEQFKHIRHDNQKLLAGWLML